MFLVVRLGAMGDIVHTLPAVTSLKAAAPITWIIEPKWAYLLEGNPHVDRIAFLDRSSPTALLQSWRDLRAQSYDLAIDCDHNFLANDLVVHNSHSSSFALLAYASAYLKAHHGAAFYSALLNYQPMGFYHSATVGVGVHARAASRCMGGASRPALRERPA